VPAPDARPGDKLEITVRPEKMTLTSGEASNPRRGEEGGAAGAGSGRENACALRATVTEVVYLGTSTNYNVTTSAGAEVVVFSQNTSAAAEQPPQCLRWLPGDGLFFPRTYRWFHHGRRP
jgi:spermidine/putrescine transport system ATP-binding protein